MALNSTFFQQLLKLSHLSLKTNLALITGAKAFEKSDPGDNFKLPHN